MTAMLDGPESMIRLPLDPGGAGKFQAYYLVGKLKGYDVKTEREEGSKPYRANPLAAMRARICQPRRRSLEQRIRGGAVCFPQRRA
jgi:phage terminase large subunit-like protein